MRFTVTMRPRGRGESLQYRAAAPNEALALEWGAKQLAHLGHKPEQFVITATEIKPETEE